MANKNDFKVPCWTKPDGTPVSCTEKVKVLNENYEELRVILKDALEDALILGCSEDQVRASFHELIDEFNLDVREEQVHP